MINAGRKDEIYPIRRRYGTKGIGESPYFAGMFYYAVTRDAPIAGRSIAGFLPSCPVYLEFNAKRVGICWKVAVDL